MSFDQPITAIVGSNGCGKSNVVDALYWVMGDMSPKHLRGHSMSDVIFSGSRDTAPLDMAEVTLVMERTPGVDPELAPQFQASSEIQLTRRYYRSGDSEYLINKVPCRLRDIQEFFMDTGMGAKAYSIIEQGAISRLVTQKPEERRVVIEEVAGIMKFKARKAETERKIENSKVNLNRIDDILKDLQKQLGTLKRQAEKAEKFRAFSDELRALEIQMGCKEWITRSDAKQQSLLLSGELTQAKGEREARLFEARAQVEQLAIELAELENDLNIKRAQSRERELSLKDLQTRLATLETKRDGQNHRLLSDQGALEQLESRKIELEGQLAELDIEIEAIEQDAHRVHTELETSHEEVEALKLRSESVRENVELTRRQLHTEELEQTRLMQQIQNHQRQLASLSSREESLAAQITNIDSELGLRTQERQSTMDHLETAFSTRTDLEQSKVAVDQRLEELEHEKTERQSERDTAREELTVTRIRKEQLEALDRDLDGVDAAGKALAMHLRGQGQSETLLADAVKVPSLLEKAVEAVFGRNLQRIIAHGMNDLTSFRSVLRGADDDKARKGRAMVWIPELTRSRAARDLPLDLGALYMPEAVLHEASHSDVEVTAPTDEAAGMAFDSELSATTHLVSDDAYLDTSEPLAWAAAPVSENGFFEAPGPDGLVSTVPTAVHAEAKLPKIRTVKEFLINHPSVVGPLADLIRGDLGDTGAQEPDWLNLVSGFWVVRDSETIEELAPMLSGLGLGLVTLGGDVLTRDGFLDLAPLESAAGMENVGLIQRKREISELKAKELQLNERLLIAQNAFDACVHAIAAEKEKFRELTQRLAALNPDVERHSVLLRQVESQLARLSEKQTLLNEDRERTLQEKEEITAKIDEITAQLSEAEARKQSTQELLQTHQSELQSFLAFQRDAEGKLQSLTQETRRQDQKLSEMRSRRAAAEQEKTLSSARRQHLEDGLAAIREELETLAQELELSLQSKAEQEQSSLEAQEAELLARENVNLQKTQLAETQRLGEQLADDYAQIVNRLRDIDQDLAVNDVEARNLKERIREQYQLNFDEMDDEKLKELASPADLEVLADHDAAKRHTQALRQKIENLGKVNMVAVEEFDDVSRRHEYLYIQRQDLFDAIQQLLDAIDRIDKESRHRFAEAFTAVNEAFRTTFPMLFGGGQAELRLTDPDNLLDSGVEIVAQPPGKKLQSVTLLSGGEKALTAVSLIFGIFNIKPSPFCVLDEVDAPLDDANVNRFNMQVRRMAETSQIIMITHHKKTMESCDALFGVTMERPGISKVASAKLGDLTSG